MLSCHSPKEKADFHGHEMAAVHTPAFFMGVNLFKEVMPMCNKPKRTARKEETHAKAADSQRRHAPL